MNPSPSPIIPSIRRPGQEGSAYVVALLVLVVLTIFGLTLTMMTQTEVQIAANERTGNRTLYAAETGLHASVARLLVGNECELKIYSLPDDFDQADPLIGSRVCAEAIAPITAAPCALCQINQGERYLRANHEFDIYAFRAANPEAPDFTAASALATRHVASQLDLSPRRDDVLNECLGDSGLVGRHSGRNVPAGDDDDDDDDAPLAPTQRCAAGGTTAGDTSGNSCRDWGGCEDLG